MLYSASAAASSELDLHVATTVDQQAPPAHSFEALCVPLYKEMTSFATKLCRGNKEGARDIVQDSFLKAMQAWARWSPEGNPAGCARAWMYRIVANTFIKRYHHGRVMSRRLEVAAGDIIAATHGHGIAKSCTDGRDAVDSPLGDEVLRGVGYLSADHREVVLMHYVRDMTCEAIARELGIPKNTVFTRLARARSSLSRSLRAYAEAQYGIGVCGAGELRGAGVDAAEPAQDPQTQPGRVDGVVARHHG